MKLLRVLVLGLVLLASGVMLICAMLLGQLIQWGAWLIVFATWPMRWLKGRR